MGAGIPISFDWYQLNFFLFSLFLFSRVVVEAATEKVASFEQ